MANNSGYINATTKAALWCLYKLGYENYSAIYRRKIKISKQLDVHFNSTVHYGPFKGLKLSKKTWWSSADRGAMLLGLYEKEVLESLQNIPQKYTTFIDLGAADGYYAIGVLVNNLFKQSICYEISNEGRSSIKCNAELNNVLNKIEIRGKANNYFYNDISQNDRANSILFIDIEGAEFDLLTELTFDAFNNSIIFVELHDWFFEDGADKLQKLKQDSSSTHKFSQLTMGARDPSFFPELNKLDDDDRWLICSEGRGQLMTWLRFDPK